VAKCIQQALAAAAAIWAAQAAVLKLVGHLAQDKTQEP